MHLSRPSRATLVAAVILAGIPVLSVAAPATADPFKEGTCTIVGTADDDVLTGTDGDDVICGLGGDDKITGGGGDDVLRGGGGVDVVRGGPGDDLVAGGGGDDRVFGQAGDDRVRGDAGDDEIVGGPGDDRLGGYKGADELDGLDGAGAADLLRCGPGPDTAAADPGDKVKKNCETILQNDPPTDITLVPATIPENEPIGTDIGDLTAVDPDSGDSHTFTLVTGTGSTDNALVRVDGDSLESNVRYDFEADSSLSVRVRATDDAGEFTEKAFTVTVTNANDAPVAVDDDASTGEDTTLDLPVSGAGSPVVNDTDQDGDALAVTAASAPTGGTVSVSGGQIHFVPTANLCGSNAGGFDYALSDGNGGTDTGRVTVDITCVDDLPVAADDDRTVDEDSSATTLNVLGNDSDVENDPITITSATDPAGGTVQVVGPVGAGTNLTYTPDLNFCNDPPPFDDFTYTVNGGDTATVRMTVTCVNDAPDANNDTRTTPEDTTLVLTVATAGSPTNNDTDVDGDTLTVTAVSASPVGGTVSVTAGTVTFVPTPNLCGVGAGSFGYTVSDGNGGTDTATVTVNITCVNDDPNAVNDSRTVSEDSGPTVLMGLLVNDTDPENDPLTITGASDPANGSTSFASATVTYTPEADFCGTDTFTYDISDGNGGTDTATVTVTVTCAPDAPELDTNVGVALTYSENDPPTPVAPALTLTDADAGATITGATVQISSNYAGAQDVLAMGGSHPAITAMQVGDTLTLSGTASPAAYQAALRDVTYANTSDSPSTLTRTVTFTATDDTALSGSDTRNIQFSTVDDPPNAVNDSTTVGEDSGVTLIFVLTNDTDVDGGPIAVASITQPANGTVSNNGTDVSYTPNANYCNNPPGTSPDTFTYTLTPGGTTATVSVTVTCAADPPDVTTSGGAMAYTENDPATPVDPGLTVTDPDAGAQITGATVAITANFAGAQDVLALSGVHPGISAGPQVGNTLTLTGTASPGAYQAALRDVTYANTSEGPSTLARTVTFTVTDNTALSDSATRGITVAGVNDPPNAVDDSGTTDEDTPLSVVAPGVLANDTDVDPGDTKIVVALNGTGTLTQTLPSGASVTINANGSYTYNPLSAFQGLSTGQTASDSFTYTMQDGAGAQDTATVNLTINGISDAPTAVADSFDAIGNTGLFVGTTRPATQAGKEITGSVLDNDTDPDTPAASLVAEPVTNAPTTLGGTITVQADGNFTYHPDDVDTGVTDTFTYRVCDASPCNSGTVANATGTLSLPIAGQVWYVRNNEPAGGDGTSDTPFDTSAEAEAASGTGDTVFVFDGSNTTTNLDTGYAMNANERLIGESRPLSLDPDGGGPLPTSPLHPGTSGAQPTLTAANEDVVVLASNVVVDGVDVDPSGTGGGISGGAGTDAVTVQNVNVTDTGTAGTQPGIEMDGTTGVNRFTGVTVTNGGSATAIGVRINNADRVLFSNTATNTIATTGAKALDAASTSLLTSRWNDITVTGSGTGAIRLSSTTGQPVLGDGSGTDLSLQTTSGGTAALDVASSNTVTVDSAGTDTISATGGPAADIRNSNGSQYFFDSASSTNSAGDGVNLDTNLTSPVVINAGTIAGAAGIAFDINGGGVGGGGVVYDGAINDGAGQSVEVTGRDGGGITFSGNIADSGDAGGGIVIASNSQGSTSFSGASKVLNTGAGNAVVGAANGNPAGGHLISFTNGGLDIDTTSGAGFSATNGTVTVGGTGNSISTGTGTGLNVDTAGITVGNLNFDSISSNGAASGIRLFTTGTTGRLIVTGTGGTCTFATPTCTGGNIANSTDDGISLVNTASPTFTRLNVHDGQDNGLRASDVSALSIDNSIFVDNSDDIATNDEANLRMHNVTGSSSVTNSLFREARVNEVYWTPTTATATMTWTSNTVGPDNAGELGAGLLLNPTSTATTTLNVSGGSFSGNNGDSLRPAGSDQSATTVNVTGGTTFLDSNSGVNFSADDDADLTFNVTGATFTRHASHALQMIVNDNTTASSIVRGKALNNIIGNGTADSGSRDANGISYDLEGAADIVLNVSNNTIRNTDTQGIFIQSVRFPTGTPNVGPNVDLTLRDNTVTNIDDNSAFPFGFQHGTQVEARRNSSMCLDIAGNTSTGIGGAEHFRIRQRDASTFRLERQGAVSGTNDAALATFIAGQNDAGSTASVTHSTTFTAVADGFCDDVP